VGDLMGGESRIIVLEVDFSESAPLELEVEIQVNWYQGARPSGLTETLRLTVQLSKPAEWPDVRQIATWLGFTGLGAVLTFAIMKFRRGLF